MAKSLKRKSSVTEENPAKAPSWYDQLNSIELSEIHENRQVNFALLNAANGNYLTHIAMFQNYSYIHPTSDIKPLIFEEIVYIVKNYPAWDRPYIPEDIESCFEKACFEAKSYVKKFRPIPLQLMASLIKLRAIMLIHEDLYYETHPEKQPSVLKIATDNTPCSSEDHSHENVADEKRDSATSDDFRLQFDDEASEQSEIEYDRDTMDMVYNFSSNLLQGYVSAMQVNLNREVNPVKRNKEHGEIVLLPWEMRHCNYRKVEKLKVYMTTSRSQPPVVGLSALIPPSSKTLFMVLIGFYDNHLIKELHEIGINLYCVIAFGGEDEDSFSADIWHKFIDPVYFFTPQKKKKGSLSKQHIGDKPTDHKGSIIMMFWIKLEELCEANLIYTKDMIWFHYPNDPLTSREKRYGLDEYWKHGAKLYRVVSQYLHSLVFLMKYHRLYLRSLNVLDLGENPKIVPVGKMFYYNEYLKRFPADCVNSGHILDGLLDEVSSRATTSTRPENEACVQIKSSNKNKTMKRLLHRLLRKYKFAYMPTDPIRFYHTHLHISGMENKIEVRRGHFETYDTDNIELATRYYPKLKNQLKSTAFDHLKKSFPAALWRYYDCEEDFEVRSLSSHAYQTWLSYLKLTARECNERMAIQLCDTIKCKGKTKAYNFCELHKYFVKPLWVSSAKGLNQEPGKVAVSSQKNDVQEKKKSQTFHWQEHLTPEVLLQQIYADFVYYECFDYVYVPFLHQIIMRFHDPTDEFGASVYIWEESIRSPVGLYNFFKYTIFEDSKWLQQLEDTLTNLSYFPSSHDIKSIKSYSSHLLTEKYDNKFADVPYILTSIDTFEGIFVDAPFVTANTTLPAFNLTDRAGAGGTSTIFHSSEGLKITVDVSHIFSVRTISLKLQGDGHLFVLHANPLAPLLFHFEALNGTRIVFGKPEITKRKSKNGRLTKKPKTPVNKVDRVYLMEEINYISFAKRSAFGFKRYITEKSLHNLLGHLLSQVKHLSSSTESLRDVESGQKIVIKSTTSLTDISKRSNPPPIIYENVFKELRRAKRRSIPHFRIISSALHKRKYVIVSPATIILRFSDCSIPIRFMPNVNVSKRIEFSKCPELDLPFPDEESTNQSNPTYDLRITLPSGLQIFTYPDLEDPKKWLIVQSYATVSPMNVSVQQELSRTFTRQGYIRIKYHDGSIKMIGINGRTIVGKIPCLNRTPVKRRSKVYTENVNYNKYAKLQKSIHKKINRYQKRMIDKPGVKYLNQRLSKRDKYFKTLLDNLKKNSCVVDYSKLNVKQILSSIEFKIEKDTFQDHYKFNYSTKNSFTSINADGEQTTTFTDATRITSWFKMEQEMILSPSQTDGRLEKDLDDYTCNFLIPKTDAWIDVSLSLQFEHPQYATVRYKSDGAEVSILLPDNIEVRIKPDGTYFINLNDSLYANVSTEEIKIRSNFCKKCYDSCETIMHIRHLYDNDEDTPPNDILLEARDNFNKYFKVEYCGLCHRNKDYDTNKRTSCTTHRSDVKERFYSFDKNFNGVTYWTNAMLMGRVLQLDRKNREHVKFYLDHKKIIRAYEIITYFINHYCDRFLMPYRKGNPPALKGFETNAKPQCFGPIAYTKKRILESLPISESVVPLLKKIDEWNVQRPWQLQLPTKEMVTSPKPKPYLVSSTENINLRLPPNFTKTAITKFKELNAIATNFRIGVLENVDSFTKKIDGPVSKYKLDSKDVQDSDRLFDIIDSRHEPDALANRLKMAWSYVDNSAKFPPVPVNSRISTIPGKESHATLFYEKLENEELSKEPSDLEFLAHPVSIKTSKTSHCHELDKKVHDESDIDKLGTSVVPLLKPGLYEWRKANLDEPSSSTSSERDILTKKIIKHKKHFKNKGTETIQPFDLLGLEKLVLKDTSKHSVPLKKHAKNACVKPEKMWRKPENIAKKCSTLPTKQSVMFESHMGLKNMEEWSKIFEQVNDIKSYADSAKKSYSDPRKVKKLECGEPTNRKSDGHLPLILKSTSFTNKKH